MYVFINIIGVLVFVGVTFLLSKKRKDINWKSIGIMLTINIFLAWFLTHSSIGTTAVESTANGFKWLVDISYKGIAFALPDWVHVKQMNFVTSALLPILMIVPMFDILTYIGILPWIIKWLGKGLAFITRQPRFESFFAVEMMFLGNTEALLVSKLQLNKMKSDRIVTIAMMSMSCITASILGAYILMMPGQYIIAAVPINIINAIVVTSILNPVKVSKEEDVIATIGNSNDTIETASEEEIDRELKESDKRDKEPFFSFLGDSIINSGRLILIIAATVIAFVALAAMVDALLTKINPALTLENIFGVVMFPFAWLMGMDPKHAFKLAQYMGTKLVTNEFVVMGKVAGIKNTFSHHFLAVLTVFLTSFANFSTVGMVIGAFKGLVNSEKNDYIAKNVGYMLLSGILVSLLSAALVGLFVW